MVELDLEAEGLERQALISKLISRVRWGINCPYSGAKGGTVMNAVSKLRELGFSDKEILARSVGVSEGLTVLEELEAPVPAE